MTLSLGHAPFLTAVGDGTQLLVSRSLALSEQDPRYLAVQRYIEDYGLVLVDRNTAPEDGMYGRCEQSHYATAEARQLLLTNTETTE